MTDSDAIEYIGRDDNGDQGGNHQGLALPYQVLPKRLYILPVSGRPFLPAQVQPVVLDQDPWDETLQRLDNTSHMTVGLC
ncbi:MAG: hypothetical protein GWN58_07575, partial [Anaerolineae bacterium]|nr:hypothetical protein [Anaerolineae bacterium]